ncbi:hypothetical protein [Sphingomonas sp. 35-24ZXX]|uniref:hypothetical protein n=1 Tax=Sphingomonas sp. 35-24ZXX TaxID=1545915 RepID=UPI00053BE355|nr:hypothetical protein [Sphingomonas sp. 35-24ZXX]
MKRTLALVCLLVAGCSETQAEGDGAAVTPLDAAAIDAGVIADPKAIDLAGSFADTGGTGSDAFCARGNREQGYKVGVLVTFGGSTQCEGTGRAELTGERARISLSRTGRGKAITGCSFDAYFDGSALALPGSVPAGCAAACGDRASLAGASFALVEQGNAAARNAPGRAIDQLCAD